MASQSSQLPRALQPPTHHQYMQASAGHHQLHNSNGAPISLPRRRVSYLIPPPSASQPPPLLQLPTGTPRELKARKRGNPNPLIMLANPDALKDLDSDNFDNSFDNGTSDDGLNAFDSPRQGSSSSNRFTRRKGSNAGREATNSSATGGLLSTSFTASSSSAATSTSSRHYHSNNTTVQRHPEHTLGIAALALDTSTIIDNSSSPSRKKTPGGILYSGGRDGLVASWELALPFKKRDPEEGFLGRKGRRKKYQPRWAEDTYADENFEDDENEEDDSSSDEESSGAVDAVRSRRNMNSHRDLYEDGEEAEELLLGDDGGYQASSPPNFPGSSPRLRLDPSFGQSGISSGLQLDLNRQRDRRRRSTASSYKQFSLSGTQKSTSSTLPYENRWRLDTDQLESRVRSGKPVGKAIER